MSKILGETMNLKIEAQQGRKNVMELKRKIEDGNRVALQKKGLLKGNLLSEEQLKKK